MPDRISTWFRLEFCRLERTVPCTGRQMRNSFFALNMLVWAVIVIFACKLIV
jgi:hypothetical protein